MVIWDNINEWKRKLSTKSTQNICYGTQHTQNKLVGENKLIWYSNIHTIYKVWLNKIYTGVIRSDKQLGLENQ